MGLLVRCRVYQPYHPLFRSIFENCQCCCIYWVTSRPVGVSYWLIRKNPELRADVFRRFFSFKSVKAIYIIIACFMMPVSILLAQAISLLFGYSSSQFVITGHFTFTSGIFPVWLMLIIAPILEELGWHSYGTDCMRNKMNLFKTSLLFGAFWGIWHIPLTTIRDYYQSNPC